MEFFKDYFKVLYYLNVIKILHVLKVFLYELPLFNLYKIYSQLFLIDFLLALSNLLIHLVFPILFSNCILFTFFLLINLFLNFDHLINQLFIRPSYQL